MSKISERSIAATLQVRRSVQTRVATRICVLSEVGDDVEGWEVGDAVASAISADDAPDVTRDGAYTEAG
jgi:NADPH:quinone reductase-like Zn-dependent oxidoreductase